MAITTIQSPPDYAPVYNGLHLSLSSTNSALPNFTIQATVKDGSDTLAVLDVPPRPDGFIIIDVGRVVEERVAPDINPVNTVSGWGLSASFNKYTVELQESFGASPSPTGSITTITKYAFNGALRYFDFNNYNQADYLVSAAGTQQFLTDMPRSVKVRPNQAVELGMFTREDGGFNPVYRAIIKMFDVNGVNTQMATVDNPYNNYAVDANRFLSFICGPENLNDLTLDTGSQPLFTDGTYRYTVEIESDDGPQTSTIVQEFIIDRRCSKYDDEVTLYFLNPLGRFDSFAFNLANQQSYDFIRQQYRKYSGQVSDAGLFSFNEFGEQRVIFDTQEQEKWRLTADYIEQDVALWLRDLMGSPKVYMTHPQYDDALVEVNIEPQTYTANQRAIDRLFNIEFTIQLSALNFRQRL